MEETTQQPQEKQVAYNREQSPFANKPEMSVIKMIQQGQLDPKNLKFEERMGVVAVLRFEGVKTYEIAALLQCATRTIDRYIQKIKRRDVSLVKNVTVERVGGNLIRLAENLKSRAIKSGDTALAWKIECELVDKLQSLGFIYKRPLELDAKHQEEVNVNINDQREQEELRDGYRQFLSQN